MGEGRDQDKQMWGNRGKKGIRAGGIWTGFWWVCSSGHALQQVGAVCPVFSLNSTSSYILGWGALYSTCVLWSASECSGTRGQRGLCVCGASNWSNRSTYTSHGYICQWVITSNHQARLGGKWDLTLRYWGSCKSGLDTAGIQGLQEVPGDPSQKLWGLGVKWETRLDALGTAH